MPKRHRHHPAYSIDIDDQDGGFKIETTPEMGLVHLVVEAIDDGWPMTLVNIDPPGRDFDLVGVVGTINLVHRCPCCGQWEARFQPEGSEAERMVRIIDLSPAEADMGKAAVAARAAAVRRG